MNAYDEQELDRLAYACVTRTLDPEEHSWVNQQGQANQTFQTRLHYWQERVASLDLCLNPKQPPDHVWHNIAAKIAQQQGTKRSWWLPFTMAASLFMVALLGLWQTPINNTSINLDNQWLVQLDSAPQQLTIKAGSPMVVPEGMVCNLWFKVGKTVVGIVQLPLTGSITLDLKEQPQLLKLLQQSGTMMVTLDDASSGLDEMLNQAMINGQWL